MNDQKRVLRQKFIDLLKRQTLEQRLMKSRQIAQKLFALPSIQKASTIMFYASMPGEVDTFAMMEKAIEDKKRVVLPYIDTARTQIIPIFVNSMQEIQSGQYGIMQPSMHGERCSLENIDAVIVPGLAFDQSNNRLGRGVGYYDRFLATLPAQTPTIGLGFDFQLIDCLPTQAHDIKLAHIIAN